MSVKRRPLSLFLSCEHGGNVVPAEFVARFNGASSVLRSHRGLDIGAADLFDHLRPLAHASIINRISRLCIELNRTADSKDWLSPYMRGASPEELAPLIDLYTRYRQSALSSIREGIAGSGKVLHVSVHSFTPELNGKVRTADIGLLFDPDRPDEARFCEDWRAAIRWRAPGLRVRMNYPYKGTSDGFTTTLRTILPRRSYLGIELEVNQRFARREKMHPDLKEVLHASLSEVLGR